MKKKKFKITKTQVEHGYIYASSEEVAQELLNAGVPIGWQYIPEGSKWEIEEVEEDADK